MNICKSSDLDPCALMTIVSFPNHPTEHEGVLLGMALNYYVYAHSYRCGDIECFTITFHIQSLHRSIIIIAKSQDTISANSVCVAMHQNIVYSYNV